jgi:hypothetical protein
MILLWGKKRVESPLGQVADFCPICREVRAFEIFRAGMVTHICGVVLGTGELLGYVKQCKHCDLRLGADAGNYAAFDAHSITSLEVLADKTFPTLRTKYADRLRLEEQLRNQPGAVAPGAKEGYLMEPWVLFNGVVEPLFAGKLPLDLPSGLSCVGTMALTGLLLLLAALAKNTPAKTGLLSGVAVVLVGGTGFTWWQMRRRPHRYVRRKIVPFLAQSLKPLAPTRSELEACFNQCRAMRLKIATAVSLEQIAAGLEHSQAPLPALSRANRMPRLVPAAMLIGTVLFLAGGFAYLRLASHPRNEADETRSLATPASSKRESNELLAAMQPTNAAGFFVPAPRRTDTVYDPKRNLLYIPAGEVVLRYQMAAHSFLPPLELGGNLMAIDLSPDNEWLVVADDSRYGDNIAIHQVALETGARSLVKFPAEPEEAGTFSVVFAADGAVWITSFLSRSGRTSPLRKYIPATRQVIQMARLGHDAILATSADHEYIAYACADQETGSFGWFRCRASRLPPPFQVNASLFEVAISRDGSQLALPNQSGVTLSGAAVPSLDETNVIGVAYHPQQDFIFLARSDNSKIEVLDTANYTVVKELEFGVPLAGDGCHAFREGRLRLSGDGAFIFCTVPGGVRCAETRR